jgi:hypothetical protein
VLLGVRVAVAGGEDDLLPVGAEVAAGGAADAGADARGFARRQVHDEDLVERVAGALLLGLEDDLLAVGRKVPLAGAHVVEGNLLDVLQVRGLGRLPVVRVGGEGQRERQHECVHRGFLTGVAVREP